MPSLPSPSSRPVSAHLLPHLIAPPPPGGSYIWIDDDCNHEPLVVEVRLKPGDDLLDEGAESAVYEATANVGKDVYLDVLRVFRGSDIQMVDPYDGRALKVAFKSISFDGDGNSLKMTLIEDID